MSIRCMKPGPQSASVNRKEVSNLVTHEAILQATANYLYLRSDKDLYEAKLKETNKKLDIAEQELSTLMVTEEIPNFHYTVDDEVLTIYLSSKFHAQCPAANREELRDYLIQIGHPEILFDSIDDKKLTGYVKTLEEIPEELSTLIKVFERPTVNVRKNKNKEEETNGD